VESEPNEDGTPSLGAGFTTFGNDLPTAANVASAADGPITTDIAVVGTLPAGDEDMFAIRNNATGPAVVRLTTRLPDNTACGDTIDTVLRVYSPTMTSLVSNDDIVSGTEACSELQITIAAASTVYAHVMPYGDNVAIPGYRLNVQFIAVCGNGTLEAGETCENPGVGSCDASCQLTQFYTVEDVTSACATLSGAATSLGSTGDTVTSTGQALPFAFSYFATPVTHFKTASDGYLGMLTSATESFSSTFTNGTFPSTTTPNGIIAPFWDDLTANAMGTAWSWETQNIGGVNTVVVEWRNWRPFGTGLTGDLTFQVWLRANNEIQWHYCTMTSSDGNLLAGGSGATVGLENKAGTRGTQVSRNTAGSVNPTIGKRFVPLF
jgi:hypothetical protein